MNANELADELDKYKGIATKDAATMLREQHSKLLEQHERLHKYALRHAEQRKRIDELEGLLQGYREDNRK